MSGSIRKFKNNDELIKELENRSLVFPDEESKKIFKSYLTQYGYFSFVKKMSHDLMYSDIEQKIFKKEFTSNNLRYLFDIDRNISAIIFKYFRNIEFLLNSSLLKIVAKKINKNAKCPYIAALDGEGLRDVFPEMDNEMPKFKQLHKNTYVNFHEDIFKNFNNIDFDCREAIKENENKENDEIKNLIEKGWFKDFINKNFINNKNKQIKKPKEKWEYLDIFSLFQTLTFSQLLRIFSYLSTSSKNEVIKEFFNDFKPSNKHLKLKEEEFKKLINYFSDLRNVLMHNGSLIKINFKIDQENKESFEKYFNIQIPSNEIKLNDIVQIMESIINIKDKILKEIEESITEKIENRTQRSDQISNLIFEIIEKEARIKKQSK